MTGIMIRLVPWLSVSLLMSAAASAQHLDAGSLSSDHRKWLEEDVAYIITEREREVFLSLETQDERARFIDAFWRRRDPNPATQENEFQQEHYRRLAYANEWLGRESHEPGWKTDQGRVYVILGEPRQVQRFDTEDQVTPSELWFYQGEAGTGLPPFFYLLFFKPNYVGAYELYDPVMDGPEKLVRGQYALSNDPEVAVAALSRVSWELARASLSFDVSEPVNLGSAQPSMTARLLVNRILDLPKRRVRTEYAEAWLRDRDRVSSEYSFNFVSSRSVFAVLAVPGGEAFLHLALELEPSDFSVEADVEQARFYTTLDVTVEVTDGEGSVVEASEKAVSVDLSAAQMDQIRARPISYQESLPLVSGDYHVNVVLKNRAVRQYTVAEGLVHVPAFGGEGPELSGVVLGYEFERLPGSGSDAMRVFQAGDLRIVPAAGGIFRLGETAYALCQIVGESRGYRLDYALLDGERRVLERRRDASDYENGVALEAFPLTEVESGSYLLRVEILDGDGKAVADAVAPIQVSPRTVIPRPAFFRRISFGADVAGQTQLSLGRQLLNLGRTEEAQTMLARAVAAENPRLPMASWLLARTFLDTGAPDRALELLRPFEKTHGDQFEVAAGLGMAHFAKGDLASARARLEHAMSLRPLDTRQLNALAESLAGLGHRERAREIYERSLALDPDQEGVRARLEQLSDPR